MKQHQLLYSGYVRNTNSLLDIIKKLDSVPEGEKEVYALAELRRRFAFEYNGMVLHELFFESLSQKDSDRAEFSRALETDFGTFENWQKEVLEMGIIRGIGWVLLVKTCDGLMKNIWIGDHEIGHLANAKVIFALDMWEHAYLNDYAPAAKKDYIAAVIKNTDWSVVSARLH